MSTTGEMLKISEQEIAEEEKLRQLQSYLVSKFRAWQPATPRVLRRRAGDVTLDWTHRQFSFLGDRLLYRLERSEKLPHWVLAYSGGKTSKNIERLAPRTPYRFRVRVTVKPSAVPRLALLALRHYGHADNVIRQVELLADEHDGTETHGADATTGHNSLDVKSEAESEEKESEQEKLESMRQVVEAMELAERKRKVDGAGSADGGGVFRVSSEWSCAACVCAAADGASPLCFVAAVRRGLLAQVAAMAAERPALVWLPEPRAGLTPLVAAVNTGDVSMVRLMVSLGAELEQRGAAGRTALHAALLAARAPVVRLLLDAGADITSRDRCGLRAEHFAVESGRAELVRLVLRRGGDPHVTDCNGWTPLFRAVCGGAGAGVVRELAAAGAAAHVTDRAGLQLAAAAQLPVLGRRRASTERLVGEPAARAVSPRANFSRLSRKIHHVHKLLGIH